MLRVAGWGVSRRESAGIVSFAVVILAVASKLLLTGLAAGERLSCQWPGQQMLAMQIAVDAAPSSVDTLGHLSAPGVEEVGVVRKDCGPLIARRNF